MPENNKPNNERPADLAVQDSVSGFTGNTEQSDDITMLCLEYKGKEQMQDETVPHHQK